MHTCLCFKDEKSRAPLHYTPLGEINSGPIYPPTLLKYNDTWMQRTSGYVTTTTHWTCFAGGNALKVMILGI